MGLKLSERLPRSSGIEVSADELEELGWCELAEDIDDWSIGQMI